MKNRIKIVVRRKHNPDVVTGIQVSVIFNGTCKSRGIGETQILNTGDGILKDGGGVEAEESEENAFLDFGFDR